MADDKSGKPKLILKDNVFKSVKVGVKTGPGINVEADSNTFSGVEKPWDIGPGSTGSVKNTRISSDPKLTSQDRSTAGWHRPKGPPLPVFCPNCKTIFASQNYVFGGPFWEFWGNEEQCISCGFEGAKLSDGTFNLTREIAEIILAPDMTHAMVWALQHIALEAAAGRINPDEAVARSEMISPKAAGWLRKGLIAFGLGAFTLMNNAAGIGSFFYSKEQTEMQRSSKTDQLLEKILEKIAEGGGKAIGAEQPAEPDRKKQGGTVPAQENAEDKVGDIKTKSLHGNNARKVPNHVRKRNDRAHRRSLMKGRNPNTQENT